MANELPAFRYHSDPVATGSVSETSSPCPVCGRRRRWEYLGPVSTREEISGVCPWCVHSGLLAERFDATLVDVHGAPRSMPQALIEELKVRTPGFAGWQQERWLFHCDDACDFLGPIGAEELARLDPPARQAVDAAVAEWLGSTDGVASVAGALSKETGPTAYLFACLGCGAHQAYIDST
ncbi:MAG: CbrC family protein [Actinomycetota bacterium]